MRRNYKRMLAIYLFLKCGEDNLLIFDSIAKGSTERLDKEYYSLPYGEPRNKFLNKWFKDKQIKTSDFVVIGDREYKKVENDERGVLIYVKRKKKNTYISQKR